MIHSFFKSCALAVAVLAFAETTYAQQPQLTPELRVLDAHKYQMASQYGFYMIAAPACGMRSEAWARALFVSVDIAIPKNRNDIRTGIQRGKDKAIAALAENKNEACGIRLQYYIENADRVISNRQDVFDVMHSKPEASLNWLETSLIVFWRGFFGK